MTLTPAEFEREKRYQVLMSLVRHLLHDGVISLREYTQIADKYARQISPKTGSLLALNGLLFASDRGNILDSVSAELFVVP